MHKSTWLRMEWFVRHYVKGNGVKILDVGSCDVNGSYKALFNGMNVKYVGLDVEEGPNVDVVMNQPYSWDDLEDESFDYIISGQAFEHIEFPWLTIEQIYKKLKVGGVICIIAPNTTHEHKFPLDCYRYFGDGLAALAKWAGFSVLDVSVAGIPEKGVSREWDSLHNDACLIAIKGNEALLEGEAAKFPYERRYSESMEWLLAYEFVYKWFTTPNIQDLLSSFIEEKGVKTVFIYGADLIGQLLYKELRKIVCIKVVILEEGDEKFKQELTENAVIVITVLDYHREIKMYLNKIWKNVPIYYLDDLVLMDKIERFFENNDEVYLFGAGLIGRRLAQQLTENVRKPYGFVVSDGNKGEEFIDGLPVFEYRELKGRSNIGIIISVKSSLKREIISYLESQGCCNYLEV